MRENIKSSTCHLKLTANDTKHISLTQVTLWEHNERSSTSDESEICVWDEMRELER